MEIVCEGVTRLFPNAPRPAVDHISFEIPTGELVVLLGPSGCGKTTLLKMINRLYEPNEGSIWIGGTEIHDLPATELRRHIGYVIQQVGLFPHMTIAQNIGVVPHLLGWEKSRVDDRVKSLLQLVGMPDSYLKRHPRELSGGEQQRVGLARALAADPDILLMDEPFASLDAINRQRLQGELLAIQRKVHKTILFVTHDVEEAFRLADKIMIMKEGRLIQYGTPLEIVSQPENAFVEELVGARNILRRLSLIQVQTVLDGQFAWSHTTGPLRPAENDRIPPVRPEDNLRDVLSLFLESGAASLQVVDREGRHTNEITLEELRAVLNETAPRSQPEVQDELSGQ